MTEDPRRNERRGNAELRELLDELLVIVREIAAHSGEMSEENLSKAQERVEWLTDEIWEVAIGRDA